MIEYSQYYTDVIYSKLLVDKIDIKSPGLILDLGIGKGALTQAALKKWANADFIAIDVDKSNCDEIQKQQPRVKALHLNGLTPELNEKIEIEIGSVDVAICNPPYEKFRNNVFLDPLFDNAALGGCKKLKSITTDIIFLANNLSMLKENGYLGIIIPDGIATRKDLQILRKNIVENHTVKHIIQLPDKIFSKTEARTHILILTKGKTRSKKVKLSIADEVGECIDTILVQKELLIERMDYNFHKWYIQHERKHIIHSSHFIEISRGSLSFNKIKELEIPAFHTTHYKNSDGYFGDNEYNKKWKTAQKGDILLARVGKRCIGNALKVNSGNIIISDCIYRIRISEEYQDKLYGYLTSIAFQRWVKVFSHGVCSLVISKCDLVQHIREVLIAIDDKIIDIDK